MLSSYFPINRRVHFSVTFVQFGQIRDLDSSPAQRRQQQQQKPGQALVDVALSYLRGAVGKHRSSRRGLKQEKPTRILRWRWQQAVMWQRRPRYSLSSLFSHPVQLFFPSVYYDFLSLSLSLPLSVYHSLSLDLSVCPSVCLEGRSSSTLDRAAEPRACQAVYTVSRCCSTLITIHPGGATTP